MGGVVALATPSGFMTPGGSTGNPAGMAMFDIINRTPTSCSLQIELENLIADPISASQLISGLAFQLSNVSTLGSAVLSNQISSDGGSAPVTLVDFLNGNSLTGTKPASWQFGLDPLMGFYLNDLTGGQPKYMIIGSGPYIPLPNSSITSAHNPSLQGPVFFQIDDFIGLTALTTFSNVQLQFGTGSHYGDTMTALDPCPTCAGTAVLDTPEPSTGWLLALGVVLVAVTRLAGRRRA
jgi:hypothetical protein